MDRFSWCLRDDSFSVPEGCTPFNIKYGRANEKGVLGLYAYLFGKTPLDKREKLLVQPIRVPTELGGVHKLFLRGEISPIISGMLREVIKKYVMRDLTAYLAQEGSGGFAPLLKYSLDVTHGIQRDDFVEVLQECGFSIPCDLFKSEKPGSLICTQNHSEICILPNDQLMVVIVNGGQLAAHLANRYLIHSDSSLLQQPPETDPQREYASSNFESLDTIRTAWNEYASTL